MPERTKAELIAQVLERMAQGRFEVGDDDEGQVITIQNYGATFEQMEDFFGDYLGDLEDLREAIEETDPEDPRAGAPLEDNWSDWWTEQFLARLFKNFDQEGIRKVTEPLRGLSYEEVLSLLYSVLATPLPGTVDVVRARETLTTREIEEMENRLLSVSGLHMSNLVADEYARQLAGQFPKMIARAEKLRILPALVSVPAEVQKYLAEASKCYIYGRFIACLVVCRSAIEFAVRDRLARESKSGELGALEAQREDSLQNLIALARKELPWTVKPALDDADAVRDEARKAVHLRPPDPQVCKDLFIKTRGVLKELYS